MNVYDYLFETEEGAILVECETYEEALETAREYFEEVEYIDRLETWEGEILGYDTY